MTAEVSPNSSRSGADIKSVTASARRSVPLSPTEKIIRQVEAVDAWIAARRLREQALQTPGSNREQRLDVAREIEALRRTHDAIKGRCARELSADVEPMSSSSCRTAVIAHRHAWFVETLALLLGSRGVVVLACTDNGAEALGAVIAEQPDILLVGDRLAMQTGSALLADSRRYSPSTLLAAQASDPDQDTALCAAADRVFLRHHPPSVVADALVARHLSTTGEIRRV